MKFNIHNSRFKTVALVLMVLLVCAGAFAGENNLVIGTIEGTTGSSITVEVGFQPRAVDLHNIDGNAILHWDEKMGADSGQKIVDSGSNATDISTIVKAGGITKYAGAAGPITLTGTGSVTAGSVTVTGSGSAFSNELAVTDMLNVGGQIRRVLAITSATVLIVDLAFDTTASAKTMMLMRGRSEGFVISTDTDINVTGETITYRAYR